MFFEKQIAFDTAVCFFLENERTIPQGECPVDIQVSEPLRGACLLGRFAGQLFLYKQDLRTKS